MNRFFPSSHKRHTTGLYAPGRDWILLCVSFLFCVLLFFVCALYLFDAASAELPKDEIVIAPSFEHLHVDELKSFIQSYEVKAKRRDGN